MIAVERPSAGRGRSTRIVDISEIPDSADVDDLVDVALETCRLRRSNLFDWSYASISHDHAVITLMTD